MSEEKRYHGWTNYETWLVKLWLDNEEPSYQMQKEWAQEAMEYAEEYNPLSQLKSRDKAKYKVSKIVQNYVEENQPEVSGMYADLLGAALSAVNWYEIGEHIIDDFIEEEQPVKETE